MQKKLLAALATSACAASAPVWARGGLLGGDWTTSVLVGLAGAALLVLDGKKKQFETRAFFGVLCCVAAGLTIGHSLDHGRNDSYAATQAPTADATVAAAPAIAVETLTVPSDVILYASKLKLGLQGASAQADDCLDLPGTDVRLYVSCYYDITVHLSSALPLPEKLTVSIDAPALQPSTRQPENVESLVQGSQFERRFKMDTRCDLMNDASVVVKGLKFDTSVATPPADGKVWVSLNKK
jgi:hypothetical protein